MYGFYVVAQLPIRYPSYAGTCIVLRRVFEWFVAQPFSLQSRTLGRGIQGPETSPRRVRTGQHGPLAG
jgi:hypothetical protein